MLKIYISHPFTGAEKQNRQQARWFAIKLAKQYPDVIFINPLEMFKHAEAAKLSYDEILNQTKYIVLGCDAIYMAGAWEKSRGCNAELETAKQAGIPALFDTILLDDFIDRNKI